jgi:DNA-binding LacI/PurR family transcriptional regulator
MTDAGPTARRVTAADVAASLGLSRATVGFVLNDTPGQSISGATRARVLAEAKRLGYRPHTAARALASGRSHIVLLILPDWPVDHSMRAHLDEASLVLDRAGYSLVTTTPHPDGQAVPLWQSLSPDVVLTLAPIADELFEELRDSGAATVVAGRDELAGAEQLHFADGPRLQVEHLVSGGRRKVAYAGTADPRLAQLDAERRELAERTLRELTGRPLAAIAQIDASDVAEVVAGWLADEVDGVVAYNDDIAALVLGAALRQGVAVPERIAVVGHDDTPLAELMVPSLSSVRVDTAGLGRFLAELALSRATDSPAPAIGPEATAELVRRESS